MFHAVKGDRRGNGRQKPAPQAPQKPPVANKGDRGYSDQAEACTFLIGTPHTER